MHIIEDRDNLTGFRGDVPMDFNPAQVWEGTRESGDSLIARFGGEPDHLTGSPRGILTASTTQLLLSPAAQAARRVPAMRPRPPLGGMGDAGTDLLGGLVDAISGGIRTLTGSEVNAYQTGLPPLGISPFGGVSTLGGGLGSMMPLLLLGAGVFFLMRRK